MSEQAWAQNEALLAVPTNTVSQALEQKARQLGTVLVYGERRIWGDSAYAVCGGEVVYRGSKLHVEDRCQRNGITIIMEIKAPSAHPLGGRRAG